VTGAFVNNMDFTKLGTASWFDADSFANSMTNPTTWASTVASMAGTGVTSGLGEINLGKQMKIAIADGKTATGYAKINGFNQQQTGDMLKMNGFFGGLVSSATTYAMTGNAKFNVANFMGTGLVELNLGKDGFSMNLGMDGTDVSAGTIASTLRGMEDWGVNNGIEKAAARDKMQDAATSMRLQWGYGDEVAVAQLQSIMDGSTRLLAESGGQDGLTERIADKRYVTLSGYKEGMTREEQLKMGLVLQHEAYRDGIANERNVAETESAVYHHTEMAIKLGNDTFFGSAMRTLAGQDKNIQNDLLAYAITKGNRDAFAGYVDKAYDSSADYWKLMKNGDLVDDKRSSLYVEADNDGEFKVWDMDGLSREESLSKIVGAIPGVDGPSANRDEILKRMTMSFNENFKGYGVANMSEEAQKRVGIYSVVNANANLSESQFEAVVNSSYKVNDKLGWYVDFSSVANSMKQNVPKTAILERSGVHNVMKPEVTFGFSTPNFKEGFVYGNMATIGYSAEVSGDDAFGQMKTTVRSSDFQAETEDGGLYVGMQQLGRNMDKTPATYKGDPNSEWSKKSSRAGFAESFEGHAKDAVTNTCVSMFT
jgi:hypothetical protein